MRVGAAVEDWSKADTVDKTRAQSVKRFIDTKEDILPVSLLACGFNSFQIAIELMRRELPVRIRLLGIRLSNLKDLTVEEKEKGIKKVSFGT